jgi:aspartyl protease family protein
MDGDVFARVLYLVLLLVFIGGSLFTMNRETMNKSLQQAVIWALLIGGVAAGYALWNDISQTQSANAATNEITLRREGDGHFYATLLINGETVDFVVDTGATDMVLTQDTAERVGFPAENLRFLGRAQTANGTVRTASVTLGTVRFEGIVDTGVSASVNEGDLFENLLGMSYLSRFSDITIRGDQLILAR